MFGKKNATPPTNREKLIDRLYAETQHPTGSDEFDSAVSAIIKLEDSKATEKKRWIPSADVVITALSSLGGICLILYAELWHDRIVTSKATGFVQKPR